MSNIRTRIKTLGDIFERWLSDDNQHLLRAVHQTVQEGYFSFQDVQFALQALKKNLTREALEEWVSRSGLYEAKDARSKNIFCLHAGNLPLVGFQDALAVLLSGARYTGKISRKDPYLLPVFLNEVKKTAQWGSQDVQWSHRLEDFEDMQNDAILFAGSEQSVPEVKKATETLNLTKSSTEYLIRTAHFSMAYLDSRDENDWQDLTEAVLRYGGKGCRSVAVVVSSYEMEAVRNTITNYFENFWEENPQFENPKPKLEQRFAYNEAIQRKQLKFDNFLVQEGGLELDQDYVCYWLKGNEKTTASLAENFGSQLQSIYVTDSEVTIPGYEQRTELLSQAQQPPIFWKPDGTDILTWLSQLANV